MTRRRIDDSGHHGSTLLAALAGALAGVALGVLLADRLGGVRGIRRTLGERFAGAGIDLDELREMAGDAFADELLDEYDEDELATDEAEAAAAEALEARVLAAFTADPVLRERAVDISALDGGVIELSGWVRSARERRRAAELARGVAGVETVVNELFTGDPDAIPAAER